MSASEKFSEIGHRPVVRFHKNSWGGISQAYHLTTLSSNGQTPVQEAAMSAESTQLVGPTPQ